MIDLALCLAIKTAPSFNRQPFLTTSTVTRQIPNAGKMSNTTVLDSLIAASLGNCENPVGNPTMCSRTPVPPPAKVPTKPTPNQALQMRLYLGKSLGKC